MTLEKTSLALCLTVCLSTVAVGASAQSVLKPIPGDPASTIRLYRGQQSPLHDVSEVCDPKTKTGAASCYVILDTWCKTVLGDKWKALSLELQLKEPDVFLPTGVICTR